MHELAQFYIFASTGEYMDVYEINKFLRLNQKDQSGNYEFYVACKSHLWVFDYVVRVVAETCTGINWNCTRLSGSRERELLEDDLVANGTISGNASVADSEPIDVTSVEFSQGSQPLIQETL